MNYIYKDERASLYWREYQSMLDKVDQSIGYLYNIVHKEFRRYGVSLEDKSTFLNTQEWAIKSLKDIIENLIKDVSVFSESTHPKYNKAFVSNNQSELAKILRIQIADWRDARPSL